MFLKIRIGTISVHILNVLTNALKACDHVILLLKNRLSTYTLDVFCSNYFANVISTIYSNLILRNTIMACVKNLFVGVLA